MKKRILSILLAIMMLTSMIPVGAIDADVYNEGNAIYRYSLFSLQNGPWGANGYGPESITSIWKTTEGHSENISSSFANSSQTVNYPPQSYQIVPASWKSGDGYNPDDVATDPFMCLGAIGGATVTRWADKNYTFHTEGSTAENPGGFALKIMVPSSDTYTFTSMLRADGDVANEVSLYVAPADAATPTAEEYKVGTVSGVNSSTVNNHAEFTYENTKELTAGEYIVSLMAPGIIRGGSLVLTGTKAPSEGKLSADTTALNESGALEVAPGQTASVDFSAAIVSVDGAETEIDWATDTISDARVDVKNNAIEAVYADGVISVTAATTAEIGSTSSATVYMVLNDEVTAWCEVPVTIVAGAVPTAALSYTGSISTLEAGRSTKVTLSAKVDGVDTEIIAEDVFTVKAVDESGADASFASGTVTANEDGTATLLVNALSEGSGKLLVTATVNGAETAAALEIPLSVVAAPTGTRYRYNLYSLRTSATTGYAGADVTSVWQTTNGHSRFIATGYEGGNTGPYYHFDTNPFCYVGMLKPAPANSAVRSNANSGWDWFDSSYAQGDGYVMKIVVPSTAVYQIETNIALFTGSAHADSLDFYIIPADVYTETEIIELGNNVTMTNEAKEAGYYIGTYTSRLNNYNDVQTWNGATMELAAGEYYVLYRAPYRGFYGGSLTLTDTFEPTSGQLVADEAALNADGVLEVAVGKSVEVALDANIVWSEDDIESVDWETANVRDARVDVFGDGITASYENGKVTVSADVTASIGSTASATAYMVLEDTVVAWCEIPVTVVAGDSKIVNLTHTGNLDSVLAFHEASVTLSAKVDGVDTAITAEDSFSIEIVDETGAASDIAAATITKNEDGSATLKINATKAGSATVKITASVGGGNTAAAYEIPLQVSVATYQWNFHRLQFGQWSGANYRYPFTYAADWGWEATLGNYFNYTTEPWIYDAEHTEVTEGAKLDEVDPSTKEYGSKVTLNVGDKFALKLRVEHAGCYDLINSVAVFNEDITQGGTCGEFDVWLAPADAKDPTADQYQLSSFKNSASSEVVGAQPNVVMSGTTPFAAVMEFDLGEVSLSKGDYIITISPTSVNTENAAVVLYWKDVVMAENGKTYYGLATKDGAQIRMREPQGVRFISTIDKTSAVFADIVEFGTVLIPTEDLTDISELTIGATLNGHAVAKVPAVNYRSESDTEITFTAVVTDILPANYKRSITARAYAIMKDGTVVYGDTYTARSPYEVAENGLASETATDAEKEAFQAIIDAAQ